MRYRIRQQPPFKLDCSSLLFLISSSYCTEYRRRKCDVCKALTTTTILKHELLRHGEEAMLLLQQTIMASTLAGFAF
ncbi:MAG: hypothetical protein WA667_28825 [Candidatus Nitrosopolaris sp.]